MASLIFTVAEDFNDVPYNLPTDDLDNPAFERFLETIEIDVMTRYLLGYKLTALFKAALVAGGSLDAKWTALVDGAEYVINDVTYKSPAMKVIIRPYAYLEWIRRTVIAHTGTGFSSQKVENGEAVSPEYAIVNAYNDFSLQAGSGYKLQNTLYGYLSQNKETYPEWQFSAPGNMTRIL